MDGLQPVSYSTGNPQINVFFHLFEAGRDTHGYKFSSWQNDQFQPQQPAADLQTQDIASTRLTPDEVPERAEGATLIVAEEAPVTWGLPTYRARLLLEGMTYFDGRIQCPAGTPPFRLDGTWTRTY
ncbi:MAG: hypothetical protein EPO01_04295 [Aquabacterium sp.]|jgi:hypothetical protein|nr:MAG: hypothetical protein EPO01_04295 [Aquabacterium sp.]